MARPLLHIHCAGTPYEIGHRHGVAAKPQITRSLAFYSAYYLATAKLDWSAATAAAQRFLPVLDKLCPHLVEEMRGVAAGADVGFADVLALNVRTEIAMGMVADGCTALYLDGGGSSGSGGGSSSSRSSILAQNWDWERAQGENLVALHIAGQEDGGRPAIKMVTEAGIIGKIGLNAAGVGVCLNAIRARGVAFDRLPVHLALRTALECASLDGALRRLRAAGVAASCHILVADANGAAGLECSHVDMRELSACEGLYAHTNHWLVPHAGSDGAVITEAVALPDSGPRLRRIQSLLAPLKGAATTSEADDDGVAAVSKALEDDENFPGSINKAPSPANPAETLFSIVMDLTRRTAKVRLGRPTEAVDSFSFSF